MHALWVVHLLTVPVWAWSSNALVLTQRGDETPWGVHFYSRQLRVDTRFPAYFLGWRPNWAELRLQLLKIGYASTIGVIILLIWLGFIQK